MPNSLTRTAGLQLGPVALDTLLKHYFDRVKKEKVQDANLTQLRQDELLYDEAFNIAKRFFDVAIHHSVEEVQAFSNTRTPSPPWVHVVRVTVPMSCCDEAATLLIQVLGGEEHARLLVGGTKWWQVRGITGIAGEWLTARKDWEAAKKRRKASQKKRTDYGGSSQDAADAMPSPISEPNNVYDEEADDLRCILYAHGGGYYFGSIDQERHCLQRLARKIKGRVFAINYRLAPQYPFPCALQDLIAAYLYLIRPPPDAPHQPVKPSHIVVGGDSAGGGLTLALLQVLRDTGLPLPAGGILISPWCDLTHSFPSVHTNTATDVLPLYGLSLQKPSALWPPPSEEMTRRVHTGLRQKIRQIVRVTISGSKGSDAAPPELAHDALACPKFGDDGDDGKSVSSDVPIDVGATTSLPSVEEKDNQTISLRARSGELLEIDSQIHLYTQNSLIGHPLVSSALSYLGGLPPLFVIASDKEVLRDEIIYLAHKAGAPSRFPVKDDARALYPPLVGIEERHGPTQVHLQVYDDTAHVLPILFPFTTPGKYCYRAMATFTKHVTGILPSVELTPSSSEMTALVPHYLVSSPVNEELPSSTPIRQPSPVSPNDLVAELSGATSGSHGTADNQVPLLDSSDQRPSSPRTAFLPFQMKSVRASLSRSTSEWSLRRGESSLLRSPESQGVGSPSKLQRSVSMIDMAGVRYAGEATVYYNEEGLPSWKEGMIRERVSTQGIIRPLEPADKIDVLHVPPALIGVLSERIMRRYLEGKAFFDQKYAKVPLTIEKTRKRNIDLAKKDITRNLTQLESRTGRIPGKQKETSQAFKDGLESSTGAWGWAWADERPPPSSIVSRRDTEESRRLARIADQSVLQDDAHINNNSLWTVITNFLTASPPKEHPASDSEAVEPYVERAVIPMKKSKSVFASLRIRERQPKNDS